MIMQLETTRVETADSLPLPPAWSGYTWRPMRREDIPAVHRMLLVVDEADDLDSAGALADMQTQFDDPWSNPTTDSLLALTAEAQVAGFARTFINPQPEEEIRAFLWIEVHPDHRERGLEDFLFDWAEARARQRAQTTPGHLSRVFRTGLQDNLTDRIARLERRGYQPVRYFYRMRRDLRQPIPDKPLAESLTLRNFSSELSRAILDALNEAFRDHWSFEPITDEDWQTFFIKRSSFRPDLTCVAMDGEQVAGVSFNTIGLEENARHSISEGWVAELAVRRPWRRRGVASALLCQSMRAFKAEGLDYATLGVDIENPNGALRLYEGLGFRPVKRFIQFAKLLA